MLMCDEELNCFGESVQVEILFFLKSGARTFGNPELGSECFISQCGASIQLQL
jgi:hypothetical protein